MNRVWIAGSAGSGKTTLAIILGAVGSTVIPSYLNDFRVISKQRQSRMKPHFFNTATEQIPVL